MNIEFDLTKLSERARTLLLMRANQWGCTPAEAMGRLLDESAKRAKISTPEQTAA